MTTAEWMFRMRWCYQRRVSPGEIYWWGKAGEAYRGE